MSCLETNDIILFEQTISHLGQFSDIIYSKDFYKLLPRLELGLFQVRDCPQEINMVYTIFIYSITSQINTIYHLFGM